MVQHQVFDRLHFAKLCIERSSNHGQIIIFPIFTPLMINVALGNLSLINLAGDLVFDIMTPQENRQVKIVIHPVFSLHEFLLLLILILC